MEVSLNTKDIWNRVNNLLPSQHKEFPRQSIIEVMVMLRKLIFCFYNAYLEHNLLLQNTMCT